MKDIKTIENCATKIESTGLKELESKTGELFGKYEGMTFEI